MNWKRNFEATHLNITIAIQLGRVVLVDAFFVFESPLLYFSIFFIPARLKKKTKKFAIKSIFSLWQISLFKTNIKALWKWRRVGRVGGQHANVRGVGRPRLLLRAKRTPGDGASTKFYEKFSLPSLTHQPKLPREKVFFCYYCVFKQQFCQ
jgi:hypothetical protein